MNLPPKSRAGDRQAKYRRVGVGRLSESKAAILRTQATQQISLQALDPTEYDEDNAVEELSSEAGISYLILINVPGRQAPLVWNLTSMTTEELEAFRGFFNHCIEMADPVVRERDKVAQDAFAQGDDSFSRVYRTVPQLIIRQRKERTDSQGVHDGPEGSSE